MFSWELIKCLMRYEQIRNLVEITRIRLKLTKFPLLTPNNYKLRLSRNLVNLNRENSGHCARNFSLVRISPDICSIQRNSFLCGDILKYHSICNGGDFLSKKIPKLTSGAVSLCANDFSIQKISICCFPAHMTRQSSIHSYKILYVQNIRKGQSYQWRSPRQHFRLTSSSP